MLMMINSMLDFLRTPQQSSHKPALAKHPVPSSSRAAASPSFMYKLLGPQQMLLNPVRHIKSKRKSDAARSLLVKAQHAR